MKQTISAHKVVLTSFIVDLSDIILNIIVTVLSGSVVMLSQAIQGIADLITSGFLLYGLQQSKRRANTASPFGYGRELYFWTFLSAIVMLIFTAGLSFAFGLERVFSPQTVDNLLLSNLTLLIGLVSNSYALSLSYRRLKQNDTARSLWQALRHPDFIETKTTFILDLMGVLAALFGIVALVFYAITGNQTLDGIGAMIIGIMVAILSFFLILQIKDLIVGKSAPKEIEKLIKDTILTFPHIHDVLDLRTMYLGTDRLLINIEVHVVDDMSTDEIELLIDNVKARLKRAIPTAHHIQIELETPAVRRS